MYEYRCVVIPQNQQQAGPILNQLSLIEGWELFHCHSLAEVNTGRATLNAQMEMVKQQVGGMYCVLRREASPELLEQARVAREQMMAKAAEQQAHGVNRINGHG